MEALDPCLFQFLVDSPGQVPEALVIIVSDECCDDAAGCADKEVLQALSVAPDTYHQIHDDVNGCPVFRQEPMPGECNDKQLFILFFFHRGAMRAVFT